MKKLSKQQCARHEELVAQLTKARDDLNTAIGAYNAEVARLHAELSPKVDAVNAVITEVNSFVEEVHDEQESYYDERSEKWQEGDAGQAYSYWKDGWDLTLDELELEEPSPFDEVEVDVDGFEQLEDEVSS